MSDFKEYRRKQIAELRPYVEGEVLHGVSIAAVDVANGSPQVGDMIARNPKNHADRWLVAATYFADNFEEMRDGRPGELVPAQPGASETERTGPADASKKEETWVDRLRIERDELKVRFDKLNAFLYSDAMSRVPVVERQDLWGQYTNMEGYLGILNRRLKRAELKP